MIKLIRTSTIPMSLDIFCRGTLQALQQQYTVIALSSPGPELDTISQREGVQTIAVSMERQIAVCKDIVALLKLIHIFRRERPTIVHSITPKAGLLSMMAAWLTHVPIRIHTFTGLVWPTASPLKRSLLITTDRITTLCATNIIAEGLGVQSDLATITHKTIDVLGYGNIRGIDLNYYQPSERDWTTSNHFLYVGRIVNDKGIRELIAAFTDYYKLDQTAQLTIVGTMEQADGISLALKQTILTHHGIHFVGQQSDVRPYYQNAHCLILPSYREGFPNVVLEAGAMELPCIVTDTNGSREIVVNQQTGLIIPSHNSKALFDAIRQIAANPHQAFLMGQQARKHIAERWEKGFVQQCLLNYYSHALCSIN